MGPNHAFTGPSTQRRFACCCPAGELGRFGVIGVRLPPPLQAELEQALEEADREEGISGDELLEKLKKYG